MRHLHGVVMLIDIVYVQCGYFLPLPSLVAHTPSVAGAALFPHLNHAGKSLDTRLTPPQHGHLLVSTNIWPVSG